MNHFFLEISSPFRQMPKSMMLQVMSPLMYRVDWDFFNHLFGKHGLRAHAVLGSVLGPEDKGANRTQSRGWDGVQVPSGDPGRCPCRLILSAGVNTQRPPHTGCRNTGTLAGSSSRPQLCPGFCSGT